MSDFIDSVFGLDGLLARRLPQYEPRAGQVRLARAIEEAFRSQAHLLGEAPCGVGKSLAYLVPAIREVAEHGKRVVVATANISLQDQLVRKDLPFLASVLPEPFTFTVLKGRQNYLCTSRLEEADLASRCGNLFERPKRDDLDRLRRWAEDTVSGDQNELDPSPPFEVWRQVCGDAQACDPSHCDDSNGCFAEAARVRARDSQIVVTNFHLLFSHLKARAETQKKDVILPNFDLLICDEAHEMADTARSFFGFSFTSYQMRDLLRAIRHAGGVAEERALEDASSILFARMEAIIPAGRTRNRLTLPASVDGSGFLHALKGAESFVAKRMQTELDERHRKRLAATLGWTAEIREQLESALALSDPNFVYWVEKQTNGATQLCGQPVDVGSYMRRHLFPSAESVVLTSATLTTGGTFDFIKRELGAGGAREIVVDSPFDFHEQALLVLPEMVYEPNSPSFPSEVAHEFRRIIDLVGGKTLGLFTSYRNLNAVAEHIRESSHRVLVQGERPRLQLLEEFKRDIGSVLLGTSSFWTGIDVPGEALTCLVIDRLPFPNPDDPVLEAIAERDKNWFMRFCVPKAVIDLRQGFGRLIRTQADRGVVVILDKRLVEKRYGAIFLRSLPNCRRSRKIESIGRFLGLETCDESSA